VHELRQSVIAATWFIFLTFPIMVIRVNTIDEVVEWRWSNMLWALPPPPEGRRDGPRRR